MTTTVEGAQKPDFQIETAALALLDAERDRYHQQLLHLAHQVAKRENSVVDGVVQILPIHIAYVLPEMPWEAIHDALNRKDNPPVDQDLYADWEHKQLQHHRVLNMRELCIVMQRNQALDLLSYAQKELDQERKACDVFQQNSANATELWELLRDLREAVELVQGFDWRLDDSPHGQEIKRRVLAVMARDDVRKAKEQKAHDARRSESSSSGEQK